MAEVDVTIEALSRVNMALKNFQIDANQISFSIKSNIMDINRDCEDEIEKVNREVDSLISQENVLRKKISSLETELQAERRRLSNLTNQRRSIKLKIYNYESRIRMNLNGDPYIENANQRYRNMIESLEDDVYRLDSEINDSNEKISSLESEIDTSEKQLSEIIRKRMRAEDKLKRLEFVYSRVKRNLDDLNMYITRYSNNTFAETTNDISEINRCIRYIEEYMMTNL